MLAKRGFPQPSVPPRDAECCWAQSYKNESASSSDGLGNRYGGRASRPSLWSARGRLSRHKARNSRVFGQEILLA